MKVKYILLVLAYRFLIEPLFRSDLVPAISDPVPAISDPQMGNRQQRARKANGILHVPLDCKTLKHALNRAKKKRQYHTISIGKGEHQLEKILKKTSQEHNYLSIDFPITIVGNGDKNEVVVVGGFAIQEGVQGNVHVQNMTIRHLKGIGVNGESPFTLEDVIVEQCGSNGVGAIGTACVARCTNVEVRQCKYSGVNAYDGGSITLVGAKTTVHHNCTGGNGYHFGLRVVGATSKIPLLHPLTKESVATDNPGGGNWGAENGADINDIQTIYSSPEEKQQAEKAAAEKAAADLEAEKVAAAYKIQMAEYAEKNKSFGVWKPSMGGMKPGLVMRNIIPVIMAGVLGIYGLIVAVLIQSKISTAGDELKYSEGYQSLSAGLCVGLRAAAEPQQRAVCPGRKPPFWWLSALHPYKTTIQNRFTMGNAKGA